MLLIVYSAGLGIPFLLTTVAMKGFFKLFSKIKKHMNIIQKIPHALRKRLNRWVIPHEEELPAEAPSRSSPQNVCGTREDPGSSLLMFPPLRGPGPPASAPTRR